MKKKRKIGVVSKATMKKFLPDNINFSTNPMGLLAAIGGGTAGFTLSSKASQAVTDFLQDQFEINVTGNVTGITKLGLATGTAFITNKATNNPTTRIAGFASALGMTLSGLIDLLRENLSADQLAFLNLQPNVSTAGTQLTDFGRTRSLPSSNPPMEQFGQVIRRPRPANAA